MKYFGVPRCPYCNKRVNLIRTWSLKKQGEYKCPRCNGISNIFLSPLVYVFGILAVFCGGAIYFFKKFILDTIEPASVIEVILPFAIFFFLSLFMVYLEKPVIKRVPKKGKNKRMGSTSVQPVRRTPVQNEQREGRVFRDEDYIPQQNYRTGPVYQEEYRRMPQNTEVQPAQPRANIERIAGDGTKVVGENPVPQTPQTTGLSAGRRVQPVNVQNPARVGPVQAAKEPPVRAERTVQPVKAEIPVNRTVNENVSENTTRIEKITQNPYKSTEISDDFFAKYNDPDYVSRRLAELKSQKEDAQ